ncbi:MAG: cytochrome oxidase small assembly protein [Sulfuritalea sp.]|jgi:hypothetical protein|nr:cytochrome oxidase small assembly protein [Polynucleobacter sp.]MCF8187771.1 cytochrome oxidase small assembly protein [Sulfuritalea sp.]
MSEQSNSSSSGNSRNLRTALILLSVAVVFFIGVIIKHSLLR